MEEKELILQLLKYYDPDACEDPAFMQYLTERIETYFDHSFFWELEETIKWKVEDSIQSARNDYEFISESSHSVTLIPDEKLMRFGDYNVPAYWYKGGMQKKDIDDELLRYKRIWEKNGYGEMAYPLLQDWYPIDIWRKYYSETFLTRMEGDLEAGTSKEAMRLYYLYSRRASMRENERSYPDKIKRIITISNRSESGKEITADLHLLLYDDKECSVRVKTNRHGNLCSTTALTKPGFPLFTDHDEEMIQQALFDV